MQRYIKNTIIFVEKLKKCLTANKIIYMKLQIRTKVYGIGQY